MGKIHQLIVTHGRDGARQMVATEDRALVDSAAAVMASDPGQIGTTYAGFCLTSLPHRRLADNARWERPGHNVTLVIDPGSLPGPNGTSTQHGVPFGSRARMILLYLQTQAVRTKSPEVELGRSMRDWLNRMRIPIGGRSAQEVKDQANRISACNLTFIWRNGSNGGQRYSKESIVKDGIRFYGMETEDQPRLWVDTVRLSDAFYTALVEHPVPVAEAALREISGDSPALDCYIWLAYRLHVLSQPSHVSWAALHAQFGFNYRQLHHFRPRFIETIKAALAVYPDAQVTVDETGITLHPSPPPIPERLIGVAR